MSTGNFRFDWRLAAPGAYQDTQPDPNASLGGFQAANDIAELAGTITSAGDLYHFTDSALAPSSTDYTGGWIIFYGEDAFVAPTAEVHFATEIIDFNVSTGEFTLEGPLPIVSVVGRVYKLFMPNNLFDAWDATTSVSRPARHRLTFPRIGTTEIFSPIMAWVQDHRPGPLLLEMACSTLDGKATTPPPLEIPAIVDEFFPPDITTTAGGLVGASGDESSEQDWRRAIGNDTEFMTPRMSAETFRNSRHRAMWMRLRFRDAATIPRPQRCVWQVFFQGNTANPEQGGSAMVIVDIDGPDLEIIMGPDRKNRRLGGSRVKAIVRDSVTKLPVPNYTPVITLDTAEGTLHPQNQEETSDDGVVTQRVYTSSALDADVGKDIDFSMEVF